MKAILKRFKEPSTWAALGGIALAAGVSTEDWAQYSALGMALVSFILGVILEEKGPEK